MVIGASRIGQAIAPATAMWNPQKQNRNPFAAAGQTPQVPQVKVPQVKTPQIPQAGVNQAGGFKPLTMNQLYHDETIGNRVDIIL
ncbi:MAG: hypothetical protein HZA50_15495 [Planctomycetes bacterium]|nr:hypothetical protein [Planctomycetota bacterium]